MAQLLFASAHLDGGEEIIRNGYIIDFGHSPAVPLDRGTTLLSFNLVNASTEKPVDFDSAWIRISNSKEVFLSAIAKASNGNVFVDYSFPHKGKYEIKVQFRDEENNVIEEENFGVDVKKEKNMLEIALFAIILVLFLVLLAKNKT